VTELLHPHTTALKGRTLVNVTNGTCVTDQGVRTELFEPMRTLLDRAIGEGYEADVSPAWWSC